MNEKQRMLKYILTHLGDNFCGSGIDSYGRAYAFTDSEIAANSLEETLYNMGYEASKSSKENLESDYVIQEEILYPIWQKYKIKTMDWKQFLLIKLQFILH